MSEDYNHNQSPRNDGLYARPQTRDHEPAKKRVPLRIIAIVLGIVFLGILWYALPRGADRYNDENLPLVRADKSAYKSEPAERGGMDIPNRDSTVFEPLEERNGDEVETLLPEAEEPTERAKLIKVPQDDESTPPADMNLERQLDNGEKTQQDTAAVENQSAEESNDTETADVISVPQDSVSTPDDNSLNAEDTDMVVDSSEEMLPPQNRTAPEKEELAEEPTDADRAARLTAYSKPETLSDSAQDTSDMSTETKPDQETGSDEVVSQTEKEPVPQPSTSQPTATAASHYVQLGSFSDRAGAETGYAQKQKQYGDLIADVGVDYQRADLGEKGVFYRVRLGPLTETRANSLCDQIKARPDGGCFVTR